MNARHKLNEQESKKGATIEEIVEPEQKPKKKEFVRVAIEESDDSEEEAGSGIKSNFPLKTPKDIDEHNRMAKKQMQQGGEAFMKKFEARAQENAKNRIVETEKKVEVKKPEPKKSQTAKDIEEQLKKAKEEADAKKKEIEETAK